MPSQAAVRNKKRRVEKQKRKQRETEEGTTAAAAAAVRFAFDAENDDGAVVGKKVKPSVVADDDIERVARTGAYGSYGANKNNNNNNDERFSIEDDEWATSQRAWNSLAAHLEKFKSKKVWAPFYYDGLVAKRLKLAGFVGKIS
jgi:hypothetical protein